MKKEYNWTLLSVILSGILLGVGGVVLEKYGNPFRTGVCVSCFMENIAGSLGLHANNRMQYIRPEIIGFILGAFFISILRREFNVRGGRAPFTRFVLGILMMIGAGVYLGCPIKLFYRISGGEVMSLIGLSGLIAGVWAGGKYIKSGFSLGEASQSKRVEGIFIPLLAFILLLFIFIKPSFILQSVSGPGTSFSPVYLSLFIGLIIGGVCYYSRYCVLGSISNFILGKEMTLLYGSFAFLISAFLSYLFIKDFQPGTIAYQGSSPSYIWDFLGMGLVGFSGSLAGGCPFRQLILAGSGDSDAGVTVLGLLAGGAMLQNFNLNSSAGGATFNGQIAVLSGFALCILIGLTSRET
ncbi:MAG: YedE family putative selenium transporter [bacterium]|nr:YedE family putative selenium transporter [bacterium]